MCWGNAATAGAARPVQEVEMMMDLESLLGGDGEAFATIDDLDGLLNDYAAAPGAAVAPGAPEIAFPKAVLKESASRDTNTYSHDSSCASPQSASDAFAPKATPAPAPRAQDRAAVAGGPRE